MLCPETLRQRANDLVRFHAEADERNEWTFFVEEMYAEDCVYTCEYAGVLLVESIGIEAIKSTHYGRDMAYGWEAWTFPYTGVYIGEENKVINHWMNRGPGRRADGRHYETPGVSFITFNDSGKICRQLDMFDLAHQMKLCDELDGLGLLSASLKESWVKPMKKKLIEMLD
ncbi:SnoaL-like protein [Sinobacterium caligoides]|uniref:SnoaL-like protein n=1 Tax=Sinobacterium caligoides TaxID=933926 RepID=A0A3N2E1X4_9GAMM|nr:nuclear transport factor 2 family protein [Sinobacterium caligoides]ROS05679.1 SnoaL-like protein [Sinobacterium caligoides]